MSSETDNPEGIDRHARRAVSVLFQRDHRGWQFLGLVPEREAPPQRPVRQVVRDGEDARVIRWQGLKLGLHPEACDDYWYNLTGRQPMLFVICQSGHDGEPLPLRVTADQDEGVAAQEVDELMFQTPMPAPIVVWIRNYVAAHWRPGPRKGSKRRGPGKED